MVQLIGPTLRFSASFEDGAPPTLETRPIVYAFWHSCILPSMYLWRNLQIRVMSSDSFDGEWMGRIMRKFGFVKVRGSASRGAVRALLGMRRELEQGWTVAFTIDGPRGPRFVAKPGPVVLARATGVPMAVFHIAVEKAWILNTWDRSMIPKPFSRALMRVSRKIPVPADADDAQRERLHAELQARIGADAGVCGGECWESRERGVPGDKKLVRAGVMEAARSRRPSPHGLRRFTIRFVS